MYLVSYLKHGLSINVFISKVTQLIGTIITNSCTHPLRIKIRIGSVISIAITTLLCIATRKGTNMPYYQIKKLIRYRYLVNSYPVNLVRFMKITKT